jgi:hypothetical protein
MNLRSEMCRAMVELLGDGYVPSYYEGAAASFIQIAEEAEAKLEEARAILFAYTDNEITAHPWWAVVIRNRMGSSAIAAGPFFSRERAEKHMEARRYAYGKAAYVYCFSGHASEHYTALREALEKPKTSGDPSLP